MFGICAYSKLHFVRILVNINPVYDRWIFADARNQPWEFGLWVREKVSCEWMPKSLAIFRAGVYIEPLKKASDRIPNGSGFREVPCRLREQFFFIRAKSCTERTLSSGL
jgi:hypothetical protein